MERIAIVGSSGAGKSTLGRALRDITGLPLHYLDMVWHLPDGGHVAPERFDAEHAVIIAQPRWIIDGTYLRTLPERLERADTAFLLSLPTQECLDAVRSRIGGPREDLPWKETKLDPEFERYVMEFREKKEPLIREALERRPATCQLVELSSRAEIAAYLSRMERESHAATAAVATAAASATDQAGTRSKASP